MCAAGLHTRKARFAPHSMQTPRAGLRPEPPLAARYAASLTASRTGHLTPSYTRQRPCAQADVDKTREVFDGFLARYPLCYAYWRQYANAVAAQGGDAEEVLERGVAATPYSTDLWLEYVDRVDKREGDSADATRTCARGCAVRRPRALARRKRHAVCCLPCACNPEEQAPQGHPHDASARRAGC